MNKSNIEIEVLESFFVGCDKIPLRQKIQGSLIDVLLTDAEKTLIELGYTPFQLQWLGENFGNEYIEGSLPTIVARIGKMTEWFFSSGFTRLGGGEFNETLFQNCHEPYNENLHPHLIYPYNTRVQGAPLIDLFSRGCIDLTNKKMQFDDDVAAFAPFAPSNVVYVDTANEDHSGDLVDVIGCKCHWMKSDSLRFLALLPDDSVSHIVSGFDQFICDASTLRGQNYLTLLVAEIARTTKPGGIVTGNEFQRHKMLGDFLVNISVPTEEAQKEYIYTYNAMDMHYLYTKKDEEGESSS